MNLNIDGKVAIITGASRGIGSEVAVKLADEGVKIIAIARSVEKINMLIDSLGGGEKGHFGVALDLSANDSVSKLKKILLEKNISKIDIIVNNLGGTCDIVNPFCGLEEWRKVFRLNFEVAIELNNMIIPAMIENKWGRIIHISSISAMENHGPVTYCAAKAALTAYVRSFGGVVAPDGVVISAVLPGATLTKEGYWELALRERPDHVQKFLNERQRIGRFGKPEEVADFICFLASDRASFGTGGIYPVDGGQGRGYFGQ